MHRRSIHVHGLSHFNSSQMLVCYLSGFSIRFQKLSRAHGQVTYVLLTRSPLDSEKQAFLPLVRLACIRHAASVHPEPGSNSPFDLALFRMSLTSRFFLCFFICSKLTFRCTCFLFSFQRSLRTSAVLIYNTKYLLFGQLFFLLFLLFFFFLSCMRFQRVL